MIDTKRLAVTVLTLCAASTRPAGAQPIDYGSLEAMFGEPVSAWVTGIPQRASDVAANITIITADEIRQSGGRSIPQVLSRVAGLDIFQDSLTAFDVGVRGYQTAFQPRLLVLIDGRQVFVDDYSRTIWDNLPVNIDDIRQIEVVKGAASALSGPNAAGGVINIVTYSPLYDDHNVASVRVGNLRQVTGDLTTTFRGDWGGAKISAGGLSADAFKYRNRPDGDVIPIAPVHTYVAASAIFPINADLQFSAQANYAASRAMTADPTDYSTIGNQFTTTSSVGVGASWQSPIGLITNNTYFNHTVVQLFETTSGSNGTAGGLPYTFHTDLLVSQFQDQFKLGTDHAFRLTLEYRFKAFSNDGYQAVPQQPILNQHAMAAGAAWIWTISDRWSWTNAVRLDHTALQEVGTILPTAYYGPKDYSQTVDAFSAVSSFVYRATEKDQFRIGYGRGIQSPSFLNMGWNITQSLGSTGVIDFEGNPKLRPTVVEDYSFDYSRRIDVLNSVLKLSVYYEFNHDVMAPNVPTGASILLNGALVPVITPANVGNSQGWGGEIELKGRSSSGFRWGASYGYANVVDQADVKTTVNYEGSAPRHHFRVLLGYTRGDWELDLHGQLASGTNMLRSFDGGSTQAIVPTRGYTSVSARIGYRLNDKWTAALSGTNLTQAMTQASPFPPIQRLVLATLTTKF